MTTVLYLTCKNGDNTLLELWYHREFAPKTVVMVSGSTEASIRNIAEEDASNSNYLRVLLKEAETLSLVIELHFCHWSQMYKTQQQLELICQKGMCKCIFSKTPLYIPYSKETLFAQILPEFENEFQIAKGAAIMANGSIGQLGGEVAINANYKLLDNVGSANHFSQEEIIFNFLLNVTTKTWGVSEQFEAYVAILEAENKKEEPPHIKSLSFQSKDPNQTEKFLSVACVAQPNASHKSSKLDVYGFVKAVQGVLKNAFEKFEKDKREIAVVAPVSFSKWCHPDLQGTYSYTFVTLVKEAAQKKFSNAKIIFYPTSDFYRFSTSNSPQCVTVQSSVYNANRFKWIPCGTSNWKSRSYFIFSGDKEQTIVNTLEKNDSKQLEIKDTAVLNRTNVNTYNDLCHVLTASSQVESSKPDFEFVQETHNKIVQEMTLQSVFMMDANGWVILSALFASKWRGYFFCGDAKTFLCTNTLLPKKCYADLLYRLSEGEDNSEKLRRKLKVDIQTRMELGARANLRIAAWDKPTVAACVVTSFAANHHTIIASESGALWKKQKENLNSIQLALQPSRQPAMAGLFNYYLVQNCTP